MNEGRLWVRPRIKNKDLGIVSGRAQMGVLRGLERRHTCLLALASSEFWRSSRKMPTLNGYWSKMPRMTRAAVTLSLKVIVPGVDETSMVGQGEDSDES
jgi:hypothetical protein